jgi:VIT1/CCC1 family predicted Fe2+/Mn2+ transporter
VKPGNSDDNEPDNAAEPDKAATDEAVPDPTEPDAAESSKAKDEAETEATEPADAEETEPADAEETEPADAEETEPADAEETEPADAEETEPADAEETEPAPEPDTKPEPKPKAKTRAKPEAKPETKPVSKAESKAAEAKAAAESEPLMVELEKAPPIADEPVMPTAAEARLRRSELPRPRVLQIAFYLAIASLVAGLISVYDLWAHKAELVSGAQDPKQVERPLNAEEAERAVSSLLWLYLVVVAALGAFLTLFAYKAQDGVRRARMLALIITLILLLFHFFFFGSLYGQLSGLFAAIAIALLYLPSTREYFGPRQKTR